ncbi:MAG: hypothetical protein ACNI3C_11940 [Candidatus Marinarcus sp.]|uniref:hypothetical protein n=1 Tax=Candidatus Marinarcus sp. TaxID=3100987 RepID=UPI003B002AF1
MSERLHEIIAEVAVLHEHFENKNILHDLEKIQEKLETVESDVKEHYYKLLMQYYFQNNDLGNLQKLLLEGIKFDMRFEDIKEAFIHITNENSVIEFLEENVVFLKDEVKDEYFEAMYNYYVNNQNLQMYLQNSLELIKKNRYICAKAFKSVHEHAAFFINEDLLKSIQEDMPYLLK